MRYTAAVLALTCLATSSPGKAEEQEPRLCQPADRVWGSPLSRRDVALPLLGEASEAEVGQSMISAVRAEVMRVGITVLEDFEGKGRLLGISYTVHIPAGDLKFEGANNRDGTIFLSPTGWLKYSTEPRPRKSMEVGVIFPPAEGDFPRAFFRSGDGGLLSKTILADELRYKTAKCLRLGNTGFRRELVYGGVSQGTVSISYREFSGNLARPAFTQELKYDLKEGREIGYRGARFEILEATNVAVKFRVLRPLS